MARQRTVGTLRGMTSRTSPTTAPRTFSCADGADQVAHHRGARRLAAWFDLMVLGFRLLAATALQRRSQRSAMRKAAALDEWDEADLAPPLIAKAQQPAPGDWLFPSFFLCMAVAALPLLGLRWTAPEGLTTWRVLADSLVFALPLIIPLPFLFAGCVIALAVRPASRTPAALGFLVAALVIGFAGLRSVCV